LLRHFIFILSLAFASQAIADDGQSPVDVVNRNIAHMQQQIDSFRQSPDAIYVEKTLTRAQAYLGAALLAQEDEALGAAQSALNKVEVSLNEAKASAKYFQEKFSDLLSLEKAAQEVVNQLPRSTSSRGDSNLGFLLQEAEQALKKVMQAAEAGKFNISQQRAGSARAAFISVLDSALPPLMEKIANTLSSAAAKNAKYYAPSSYGGAKKAFTSLQLYRDGISSQAPKHPAQALELAELALEISRNVKVWRKDKGSHEFLWLQAREQRQQLASSLQVPLVQNDVAVAQLIQAVEKLQLQLKAVKESAGKEIIRLKAECKTNLANALNAQALLLKHQHDEQMSQMKDVFRAKLERETFEIKRQKRIQALFSESEISIIANLDGSLILRLSSLKFAPASSKIDTVSFDLLSRIRDVLDIYGDRTFRIEGHTDDRGDLKGNQKLSLQRAESIRDFLIAAGADSGSLKALGYGEVRPIASNEFAKGRDMNRRIDLVIEPRHDG